MKLELKQTVALVLCLILIFSITACTSEISTPEEPEVAEETEETVEDSILPEAILHHQMVLGVM